jgi:T-lymphoma invasion and metastasis-inducing protein 1
VLVQITPATGKGSQSTFLVDGNKKHGDGISGRANGTAPICRCSSAVVNNVATLTSTTASTSATAAPSSSRDGATSVSSATPSTSKPSTTTGQSFGAKSRSGSLDQLLFLTDQLAAHTLQRQENRHTGQREITVDDLFNYLKDLNGDLKFLDKKKLAQLLLQNTEAIVAQQHHMQHQTGTIRKQHAPASRQESTGETKQIQFSNHVGPTPPPSLPIDAPTKGILQTRKGSKFDSTHQQQKEFSEEWLTRSQFQRTSSRSMEVSTLPKPQTDGGKDETTKQRHHKHHQRHFSGPEDLEALKKDIAHWLERLPYKRDTALLELIETAVKLKQQQSTTATTVSSSSGIKPKPIIKNEFADVIRPPLPQKQRQSQQQQNQQAQQQQPPPLPMKQFQRQKSADDLRVLKNNILEWLTKQQIMNQQRSLIQQKQQQQQQQQSVPSKSAMIDMISNEPKPDRAAAPPPLPRKTHQKLSKRHSLGLSENSSDFHEFPDWIQIPIDKLSKMREIQKSCTDIPRKSSSGKEKSLERKHHSTSVERKLRHSASEVVQSNSERNYLKSSQQLPSTHIQYQVIQHQQQPSSSTISYQYHQQPQNTLLHQSKHQQIPQTASQMQQQQQQPEHQPQVQYQVVQRNHKMNEKSHHSHHGHGHNNIERLSKRDKPRHRQTQRSATTGNILLNNKHHQQKQQQQFHHQPQQHHQMSNNIGGSGVGGESRNIIYQSTSSLVRCDDPMCPLLPICTDPNCYLNANSYYDTPRRASLPSQDVIPPKDDICTDPRCCEMLPLCTDPRCCGTVSSACSKSKSTDGRSAHHKFKSNSLPRCVESTRRSDLFLSGLSKDDSYSSLPKSATLSSATAAVSSSLHRHIRQPRQKHENIIIPKSKLLTHHRNGGGSGNNNNINNNNNNNKLMKSASTASLHSRRRRHKTVHFGENLLREVCQNRQLIKPLTDQPSNTSAPSLQPNIQMLYNFVEGVLSAWVDEEDDDHIKSGPDSEPERGAALKPLHRCNRARLQTIRRVVNEAASLKGTLKLGNSRYRHRHWRGTAKECNERFLRKVIFLHSSKKAHRKIHC